MNKKERQTHHKPSAPSNQQSHAGIVSQDKESAKRFANARAQLALRGFECRECVEGGFFVSRWNLTKFCRELADLEAFAVEVAK